MNQSGHVPNTPTVSHPIRLLEEPVFRQTRTQRFWSEPFRPFFVLGWVISLLALAMWPLFFMGVFEYPARAHAFLMIQGFFGAFAVGFLWTALPRMLEVPGPDRRWIAAGLGLIIANTLLHLVGAHLAGHLAFLALLGLVATFGIKRFPARRDLPPPSFVLVVGGLTLGAIGTLLVGLGEAGFSFPFAYLLGRLLLMEIFILFLVLGVAAFLAPRFLGQRSRQNLPDARVASRAWKKHAAIAGATGVLILAGAILQAAGATRLGAFVVAVPVTLYVLYQVPIWRGLAQRNWMADALRIALLCSIAAPWMRLVLPDARIASAHMLLLGGFGLLTLVVGTRVVFGHSGFEHFFKTRFDSMGVLAGLYVGGLVIRLIAEFVPTVWAPFLIFSAVLILAAHVVWGMIALPKLFSPREDPDPEPSPRAAFPGNTLRIATMSIAPR